MNYSKDQLEAYIPALRSSSSEVAERVRPFVETAFEEINFQYASYDRGFEDFHEKAAYHLGAYRSLASLDLLATATGFAIINTDTHGAASSHRTEALRESLRRSASDALDDLLIRMSDPDTGENNGFRPSLFVDSPARLLPCATYARLAGIVDLDTGLMYADEYRRLLPVIARAEREAERTTGKALYDRIVYLSFLQAEDMSIKFPHEWHTTLLVRSYIASYVHHWQTTHTYPHNHFAPLGQDLADLSDKLPLYSQSPQAQATAIRYENQADDPSFFFA